MEKSTRDISLGYPFSKDLPQNVLFGDVFFFLLKFGSDAETTHRHEIELISRDIEIVHEEVEEVDSEMETVIQQRVRETLSL